MMVWILSLRRSSAVRRVGIGLSVIVVAALMFGVVLAVPVSTSAARNDRANINVNNVGIPTFALGVVGPRGFVVDASADASLPLLIDNGAQLVPGGTARGELTIFNNSERLPSTISVAVEPVADGAIILDGVARPNITKFLRFTITDLDDNMLIEKAPITEAAFVLPALDPRGMTELAVGDAFVPGADSSYVTLIIRIDYVADPETRDYVTGLSALSLVLKATSARD